MTHESDTEKSRGVAGELVEEACDAPPARVVKATSEVVKTAASMVELRYREGVNARQIARLMGVDRSRLASAFRQEVGLTLHGYIVLVRLEAAAAMIANGTKVEAAALLVGYRDKSSFYRQFRRVAGATPAACRSRPVNLGARAAGPAA